MARADVTSNDANSQANCRPNLQLGFTTVNPQNCSVPPRGRRSVEEDCAEVRAVKLCLKGFLLHGDTTHGLHALRNPNSFFSTLPLIASAIELNSYKRSTVKP